MALIEWEERYNLGFKIIDEQHIKLVNILNELHAAMVHGKSKEVLSKLLKELIDYTEYHFKDEESYLKKYDYSDIDNHMVEHRNFVKKIIEYQDAYLNNKSLLSIEIFNFLRDWLVNHILGTDRKYIDTLKSNGMT